MPGRTPESGLSGNPKTAPRSKLRGGPKFRRAIFGFADAWQKPGKFAEDWQNGLKAARGLAQGCPRKQRASGT